MILALVCCVYIGYQGFVGAKSRVSTMQADIVTVEHKISCEGIFIRDEQPIAGDASKTAEYLVSNGEKVAKGEKIAVFFDDANSLNAYHEMRAVEEEIESLKYAYTHLSGGADGTKLDSLISISMLNITEMLENGNVSATSGEYADLLQLVLRRDGDRITNEEYQAQLSALENEKKTWQSQVGSSSSSALSPGSGYFVRYYDGMGETLTAESVDSLTAADVQQQLAAAEGTQAREDIVGGLVQGFEWYFAAVVDEDQAALLRDRKSVTVRFPSLGNQSVSVSVYRVGKSEQGKAVAIFRSAVIDESYLSARQEDMDLIYDTYTGIKVPKEALRQVDGQWGVYCLVGGFSRFKPVEWVYQTDSYYLVKPAASASEGLVMYDQIIVSGKDIENDKVVK